MKFVVKTTLFVSVCLGMMAAGYFAAVLGPLAIAKQGTPAEGFLRSEAAVVRLGIWDRDGLAHSNNATFIVTGPDKKLYKAETKESLNDWVFVDFPDEFTPDAYTKTPGIYTWKCIVDGKVVANDQFKWRSGLAMDNNDSSLK